MSLHENQDLKALMDILHSYPAVSQRRILIALFVLCGLEREAADLLLLTRRPESGGGA